MTRKVARSELVRQKGGYTKEYEKITLSTWEAYSRDFKVMLELTNSFRYPYVQGNPLKAIPTKEQLRLFCNALPGIRGTLSGGGYAIEDG